VGDGWRLGYRPAFDGLRGVAVLLVVLAHFQVAGFDNGGIVGVTIFFALSGFLITALLSEERRSTTRIRLGAFYQRRAYRLLPALFVFVGTVTVLELARDSSVPIVRNALASIFYVANWVAITQGQMGKLGHVWSLSVEEQFYLLWPAILLAAFVLWKTWHRAALVALAGAVLCAGVRLVLAYGGASEARLTFGTDTRGDALLLGCLAALLFVAGTRAAPIPLVASGTALLAVAFVATEHEAMSIAWMLTVMALGSALLVAGLASADHWRALEWPALVWVGRISYGVYLWHFLFTSVAKRGDGPARVVAVAAAMTLTFAIAAASHRFVERPFLRRKHRLAARTAVAEPAP
jgi:peptidoglycan/LPS O-acetylase OafA/YrhL